VANPLWSVVAGKFRCWGLHLSPVHNEKGNAGLLGLGLGLLACTDVACQLDASSSCLREEVTWASLPFSRFRIVRRLAFSHLLVRLVPLFVLLLELRVESLGFLGEGLVEAGVADLAH